MKDKIGCAIITKDRESMFQTLYEGLPSDDLDEIVIVNDCESAIPEENVDFRDMIHVGDCGSVGVCKAKNAALLHLLSRDCDYIFIIEDDMKIISPDVWNAYIAASKATGIQHLIYSAHGPANKNGISGGKLYPRTIIEYPDDVKIALYQHCVGAFCMYTRESLECTGILDSRYYQSWDHVEHSYRLVKNGYAPAYWWWPDLANSTDYIQEQACSEQSSVIRKEQSWHDNMHRGMKLFKSKHGFTPVEVPDTPLDQVKQKLKQIYNSKHV